MDDEKLIMLVEKYDFLYNKSNKDYKIPEKKWAVWREISKEMGIPDKHCMKRWTALRDRYAKEKKCEKVAFESGTSFKHRWHLMPQLEFLAPHIVQRASRPLMNFKEENVPSSNSSYQVNEYATPEPPIVSPSFQDIQEEFLDIKTEDPVLEETDFPKIKRRKTRKRAEEFYDSDALFSQAVETFKQFCKSREEKTQQKDNDPIYAFGKMVISTLNTLSRPKQAKAISLITELLMKLKLEEPEC